MVSPELHATLEAHARWEAYDSLVAILTLGFGLALVAVGIISLWSGLVGLAGLLSTAGIAAVAIALNKRPYQAR